MLTAINWKIVKHIGGCFCRDIDQSYIEIQSISYQSIPKELSGYSHRSNTYKIKTF